MTVDGHPGARPRCPKCGGYGARVVRDGTTARAVPCPCLAPVCPACRGAGFVATAEGFRAPVRRCACQEMTARARRFDTAEIPGRYADASFKSFKSTPENARAAGELAQWADKFRPADPSYKGVVLWGDVGRGKTHLAIAILRTLILRKGVSARFVEFTHLLGDLKNTFGGAGSAAELLDPLIRADVLVIDELGKGRNTEYEGTVLDELVSRRYNAGSVVIGTTNFRPAPPSGVAVTNLADPGAAQPTLGDRVGERVYSRLTELCRFVELRGPDHRAKTA